MTESRSWTMEELKRLRDEMRVQMNLASKEAKDEWERLEGRWHKLQEKAHPAKEVAAEAGKQVLDELGTAYRRLRDIL